MDRLPQVAEPIARPVVRSEQHPVPKVPKTPRPKHPPGVLQPVVEQVLPDEKEPLTTEGVPRPPLVPRPVRPRELEHHLPESLAQLGPEPLVHAPQQPLPVQRPPARVQLLPWEGRRLVGAVVARPLKLVPPPQLELNEAEHRG